MLGCGNGDDVPPPQPRPQAQTAAAPTPDARPAAPAPAPTPPPAPPPNCTGPDRRVYGSTCCQTTRIEDTHKFPGQVFLRCQGPQIGQPCHSKRDCDVACSCDPGNQLPRPADGPLGPKDGTRGVTGVCTGQLAIGVWMCQLDENGAVSHVIVD